MFSPPGAEVTRLTPGSRSGMFTLRMRAGRDSRRLARSYIREIVFPASALQNKSSTWTILLQFFVSASTYFFLRIDNLTEKV